MTITFKHITRTTTAVAMVLALASATLAAQSQTATQFYMGYLAALGKAKSVDDLLPFMSKTRVDQVKAEKPDDRAMMFDMIKEFAPKDVKVVKETPSASGATLEATGSDGAGGTTRGTITLVKEGGAWKVDRESWSNK
jgi:hypothetical protein